MTLLLLTSLESLGAPPSYSAADLARMAKEPGEIETITSTKSDPVGQAGLWGLVAHFIVPYGCDDSYRVVRDIERYPERLKKVKRVVVQKRLNNGLLTTYTENGLGFETTLTMLFTLEPQTRTLTSESVGKGDTRTWSQTRLLDVGHPSYCQVKFIAFADTRWIPKFVLNWGIPMALRTTASTYRDLIKIGIKTSPRAAPKKIPPQPEHREP